MRATPPSRPKVRWGRSALVAAWVIIATVSAFTVIRFSAAGPAGDASFGLDYRAFVAAGELVVDGRADLLYQPDSDPFAELADVAFVYPPWFAVLMVPWTVLPPGPGLALWSLLGLGAFAAGLRATGAFDPRLFVGALVALPGALALALGQSSFFLVAVLACGLAPLSSRHRAHGWMLGVASWKAHLLGGFAELAIADPRRWLRSALAAGTMALALLGTSAILLPGSVSGWLGLVTSSVDALASSILEVSLPGFVALLPGGSGGWRYVLVIVVGLGLLAFVVRLLVRTTAGIWEQVALAMASWMFLVPHVIVYDLLLLLIPLGALIKTRYRRDVVIVGTALAFTTTIGPWMTLAQVRTVDWAVDMTVVGMFAFVAVAARWVATGAPIWVEEARDSDRAFGEAR